jgi:hypothetical protein
MAVAIYNLLKFLLASKLLTLCKLSAAAATEYKEAYARLSTKGAPNYAGVAWQNSSLTPLFSSENVSLRRRLTERF